VTLNPTQVAISVLTIYLTVLLAHNLEKVMQVKDVHNTVEYEGLGRYTVIVMISLMCLSLFANGQINIWDPFVTMEDDCALSVTVLYVIYHMLCAVNTLMLSTSKVKHTQGNSVNSIVGLLALVALCYYKTMDNPYTIIITLIMSSRLVYKVNSAQLDHTVYIDDIIGDSVMVSILIYTGIIPQFNYDATIVGIYTFQGACCIPLPVCLQPLILTGRFEHRSVYNH
jgi:uncharacterized membrane protein